MLIAQFVMPLLQKQAVSFLHQSAAGKPLIALKLAEDFDLTDVYKVRTARCSLPCGAKNAHCASDASAGWNC